MTDTNIQTALLSVSDKAGIIEFVDCLARHGVYMLSTGGTHRTLSEAGHGVAEVSEYTGFPEMMDGRVKTLHPRIHGGLLGRLDADGAGQDADVMQAHGIRPIDLVVVNLYPFEKTVANPAATFEDAIENIDIGGPAMLRSAAKNMARVTVVVDPADYPALISELDQTGGRLSAATRFKLARKAFKHVADYDVAISNYLESLAH